MNKFNVGDRVGYNKTVYYNHYDEQEVCPLRHDQWADPTTGVVTKVVSDTHVKVEWETGEAEPNDPVNVEDLLTEEELKAKLVDLESEFKNVSKEVKAKMKEASKLVLEANKMASKINHDLKSIGASGDLVGAMDASGWNSSSWDC